MSTELVYGVIVLTSATQDTGRVALPVTSSELLQDTVDLLRLGFEEELATQPTEGVVEPEASEVEVVHVVT